MKDYLAELVRAERDPLAGIHLAREYLQARILMGMQRSGAFVTLAFHGGTALRFLYQIPRYSEDLDFALEMAPSRYDFRAYLKAIKNDLAAEGYPVELRVSDQKVVHSAFVKFRGLLHEFGLSPNKDAVLSIKIEVDTNPPQGAALQTTIVRRYMVLNLQHHDRASLLAGKLHAVLMRSYTKGRDLYDLFWYLSNPEWPSPNLALLNHALTQTGWQSESLTPENWHSFVLARLDAVDWSSALDDVRPFLMDPLEADLLTEENLRRLLGAA